MGKLSSPSTHQTAPTNAKLSSICTSKLGKILAKEKNLRTAWGKFCQQLEVNRHPCFRKWENDWKKGWEEFEIIIQKLLEICWEKKEGNFLLTEVKEALENCGLNKSPSYTELENKYIDNAKITHCNTSDIPELKVLRTKDVQKLQKIVVNDPQLSDKVVDKLCNIFGEKSLYQQYVYGSISINELLNDILKKWIAKGESETENYSEVEEYPVSYKNNNYGRVLASATLGGLIMGPFTAGMGFALGSIIGATALTTAAAGGVGGMLAGAGLATNAAISSKKIVHGDKFCTQILRTGKTVGELTRILGSIGLKISTGLILVTFDSE